MYRVIIVDDEELIRQALRDGIEWDTLQLELAGEAANGREALELIQKTKPQIIITDIKMPFMDGITLIKTVKKAYPDLKIIILSGYSDYEYLKEAIQYGVESYLLKPIDDEELVSILNSTVQAIEKEIYSEMQRQEAFLALRDNTLNRLITNAISLQEFKEKAGMLDLNLAGDEYLVCTAMLNNPNGILSPDNQQRSQASCLRICAAVMTRSSLGVSFPDLKGNLVLLFHNSWNPLTDVILHPVFAQITAEVNAELNLTITFGMGIRVSHLSKIHLSYQTAQESLNYGVILKKSNIIHYREIETLKNENCREIGVDFQIVANLIKAGKKDDLGAYFDSLFSHYPDSKRIAAAALQNIVLQTVIVIVNIIGEIQGDITKVSEDLGFDYSEITRLQNAAECSSWLKIFVGRATDFLWGNPDRKMSKMVKKALDYIMLNYAEDISLKKLATQFYINASYLGQIFRKETGESFTDYVNRYRIRKAEELLTESNLKVYEIAVMVGFADPRYFIKIFKKYAGVNPSEVKRRG